MADFDRRDERGMEVDRRFGWLVAANLTVLISAVIVLWVRG